MKGTLARRATFAAVAVAVNVVALVGVYLSGSAAVEEVLASETQTVVDRFGEVMDGYEHSFLLFSRMMAREVERNPDPGAVERFLKEANDPLQAIEGDTFDGLYLYYQGRYLYSWDTPYSVYEESGYIATERPWYLSAVAADGDVAFTPPYMSYANHYVLSTVSQLQPDGRTVFAYDIKMGDIQAIAALSSRLPDGEAIVFDANGTVIGSTDEDYLGGNLRATPDEADRAAAEAAGRAEADGFSSDEERQKAQEEADAAAEFASFRRSFDGGLAALEEHPGKPALVMAQGRHCLGLVREEGGYGFLALVPLPTVLAATAGSWLVPLLLIELLLVYAFMRAGKAQKARELRAAYVELGQMQSRLEIALAAAKKDAAIDELTGMMNARSFKKKVADLLEELGENGRGIFIMLDGDHFKAINDTYGHDTGDEAIKLSAQMIVGRIRTVDAASRLHGDEFAIFLSGTDDYGVAERLVRDINETIAHEAAKRGVPGISLSAGAVAAVRGDSYTNLSKRADEALYQAKKDHNGGFSRWSA